LDRISAKNALETFELCRAEPDPVADVEFEDRLPRDQLDHVVALEQAGGRGSLVSLRAQ
jgi:hypothetical protein